MAAHSTFAGLRALAAKVGLAPAASTDTDDDDQAPPAGDTAAEGDDDTGASGDDADAGNLPAGDDAGAPDGEAGEEDAGGDDTPTASTPPAGRSADFLAGMKLGAQQEAGRFAAVLISPVARANLEMATDLLATSTMTPSAIIQMCDRYKGENSAKRLLDATPRPNLGASGGGAAGGDEAKASRAAATAKVNARNGGGRRGLNAEQPVRKSRRAQQPGAAAPKE